jgi:hypothetical protein
VQRGDQPQATPTMRALRHINRERPMHQSAQLQARELLFTLSPPMCLPSLGRTLTAARAPSGATPRSHPVGCKAPRPVGRNPSVRIPA